MKRLLTQAKDNAGLLTIVGGVALLAGSYSHLEKMAWLIDSPKVAYAAQSKNEEQQTILDRITAVLEYQKATQQQMPMQQQYQSHIKEWTDSKGGLWCCDEARQDCRLDDNWWKCDK